MPLYRVTIPVKGRTSKEITYEDVVVEADTEEGALLALSVLFRRGGEIVGNYSAINNVTVSTDYTVSVELIVPDVQVTVTGDVIVLERQREEEDDSCIYFGIPSVDDMQVDE